MKQDQPLKVKKSSSTLPLKIAQVTATFPPYSGGTGNVCWHYADQLAGRGHSVKVFTAAMTNVPAQEEQQGFLVQRLPALVQVGNAPILPGLLALLRGFDLIHLHYPFIAGAEITRLAAWRYSVPLIVTFHNDLIGEGYRDVIFRLYQNVSSLISIRSATQLCVVSHDHYLSSRLHRTLVKARLPVSEIPNGVDTSHFQPVSPAEAAVLRTKYGIPTDVRLLLCVATLDRAHYFKGLEFLLLAMTLLPANHWLLVVGDGDLKAFYQQKTVQLGLENRVRWAGAVVNLGLPPYYTTADLTVLPSLPPESFGLVLIESLACETPVVASNIAGVRTVVENGRDGLLVEPANPIALAQAITSILDNELQRQKMGKQGRLKVLARYDWNLIGNQLEQLYCKVFKNGPIKH